MRGAASATLLALLVAGCAPAGHDAAGTAARAAGAAAAQRELGRGVYNFRCYFCHGYSGDARTLASTFLEPHPRDFTAAAAAELTRDAMRHAVRDGRDGTAMKGFASVLSPAEIEAVVEFVRDEFIERKLPNTRYHTAANGWPDHDRYRAAFPFATGSIALDTPTPDLAPELAAGKRLYMGACVSCHDRGRARDDGATWELRAVSYPPNVDACLGCHVYSDALHGRPQPHDARGEPARPRPDARHAGPGNPYARHDIPPRLARATPLERRGEALYQRNCAFCHAADGSGRNWIGAFLEPHPRDLTDREFARARSRRQLAQAIGDGIPGTSMPAWKAVLEADEIDAVAAYIARAFLRPDVRPD